MPDPAPDRSLTIFAPGLWAMVMIHLGALLAFLPAAAPSAGILWFALGTFVVRNFCVMAGYHRYFAHGAFKTSRWLQFVLAFVGGMAVTRSALWWAAHHRQHHRWSDREGDPHSPRHGFWWSHMLWFIGRDNQRTRTELIQDLTRYPELRWLDRHEWAPVVVFVAICYGFGGFAGWVWAANVSSVLLCHSIFAINSISHLIGSRPYPTDEDSTNNLAVALFAFGEGWHNNHHRFPTRARLGEGFWQIDFAWWGIWLLQRLGLVWKVR